MPWKTKSGSHYHMKEGCHRATIQCGTEGLTPCSDCCGGGHVVIGPGSSLGVTGAPANACDGRLDDGSGMPAGKAIHGSGDRDVTTSDRGGTRSSGLSVASELAEASFRDGQEMPSPDSIPPERLVEMTEDGTPIEGADYDGKGRGWPVRRRGQKFHMPGGSGYSYLTQKQAGIIYGAMKRGDIIMDAQHTKEMYDIVGVPWSDMDVHDRQLSLHLSEAIEHIFAGRTSLAQACLDGKKVTSKRIPVGTRKVTVTDDNWLEFASDLDHDYEIGDVAEEEVFQDVWVISDTEWDKPIGQRWDRRR